MLKIAVRVFCFLLIAAIAAIVAAQNIWSYINTQMDANILHAAADSIGPFLGIKTDGDKTQQHNVIQMIVDWISIPIGIAAGFAALFILEVVLNQLQKNSEK